MATTRANLAWDTLLDIDNAGPGPLHERLTRSLRQAIRDGRLAPGSALPPSRALAVDLGCSRWVVTQAYEQLLAEGYLTSRVGSATRVRELHPGTAELHGERRPGATPSTSGRHGAAPRAVWPGGDQRRADAHRLGSRTAPARPTRERLDLAPGLPDLRAFPRRRWVEAVRAQLAAMPYDELAYPGPGGTARFREVMADYLRRVRGAMVDAADVTACSSVSDGVARVATLLRRNDITRIAVENPGWTRLRQTLQSVGLTTVGIPVDEEGLRVEDLAQHPDVRAVVVSPAHQFPTGVVLSPRRRAALLAWAHEVDGLILEDDYDAEFRYDRRPIGTMQGTDCERVALFGSLSKTMSPALGLGWMVTPPRWTAELRAQEPVQSMPPALDQLTFASFVESGGYDRHLRAARQRYRRRRDALVAALTQHLPGHRISGVAAGLHLVLDLEPGTAADKVVSRAAAKGVRVADLDTYRLHPDPTAPALVLGYGNLPDTGVQPAVVRLAEAIEESRRS